MTSPHEHLLHDQDQLLHAIMSRSSTVSTRLRFDRSWVSASSIAGQYYCEQKVALHQQLGEIDTEEKRRGSEGHEALAAAAEDTSRTALFGGIYSDAITVAQELLLLSRYHDLILVGQPDAVVFQRGSALLLFEFKFSASRIPYDSYHVQANVYGKILEGMGVDTRNLRYVIAILPPASRGESTLFTEIVNAAMHAKTTEAHFTVGSAHIYHYPYQAHIADKDIEWALEYWHRRRDAIPTRNPNKCLRCEYSDHCPSCIQPGP